MKNKSRFSALILGLLVLTACNVEQKDPPAPVPVLTEPETTDGDPEETAKMVVSGAVADGYLVGATVCLDINANRLCDADEPSAVSGIGGQYSFDVDPDIADNYPIVVQAGASTIDEDSGLPIGKALIMSAPAGSPAFISPLTTIVQMQLDLNSKLTVAEAEQQVLKTMGLSGTDISLFDDYLIGNTDINAVLHTTAQIVAKGIADTLENVQALQDSGEVATTSDNLMILVVQQVSDNLNNVVKTASSLVANATEGNPIDNSDIAQATADTVITVVNADDVNATLTQIDDALNSLNVSLYSVYSSNGHRSLAIMGSDPENPIARSWHGTLDPNTDLMTWIDIDFDTVSGQFGPGESGAINDRFSIVLDDAGDWQVLDEGVSPYDVKIIDNGDGSVQWLAVGETATGAKLNQSSYRQQAIATDVSHRNIREFLLDYGYIDGATEGLISNTATFPSGSLFYQSIAKHDDQNIWHLGFWDGCEGEEAAAFEAANGDGLLNCDRVSLHGVSILDLWYKSYLSDFFKLNPFIPTGDEHLDEGRAWDEDARLIQMGTLESRTYIEQDWDSGELIARSAKIAVELIGAPETDVTGVANYYLRTSPFETFLEDSSWCAPGGDDPFDAQLYDYSNGVCDFIWFNQIPEEQGYQNRIPSDFESLISDVAVLDIGAEQINWQLPLTNKIIQIEKNFLAIDPVEITDTDGSTWDYHSEVWVELLGASGDVSGDVAMYTTRVGNIMYIPIDECDADDPEAAAMGGNCNSAMDIGYDRLSTGVANASKSTAQNFVAEGQAIERGALLDNTPFYGYAHFNSKTSDPICDDFYDAINVILIGDLINDTTGNAEVYRGYNLDFSQNADGSDCRSMIAGEAPTTWTKINLEGKDYYEIDFSALYDADRIGWFRGYDRDLGIKSTFITEDNGYMRGAEYCYNCEVVTRYGDGDGGIVDNGRWSISIINGQDVLQISPPEGIDVESLDSFDLVENSGVLRPLRSDNRGYLEKLDISKTWTKTTVGDTDIISWPKVGLPGENNWFTSMAVDTNVVRQVRHIDEDDWQWENRFMNEAMQSAIEQQIVENYTLWSTQ